MKVLEKIDKFYISLIIMLVVLTGVAIYCLKTIFLSINISTQIDTVDKNVSLKISKDKLDKAILVLEQKQVVKLELR